MTPTAVVFDVGRVLVRWEPDPVLSALLGDDLAAFRAEVDFLAWHQNQDAGRSEAEALADARARHPRWAEALAGFYPRWAEALPDLIHGTVAIKDALEARGVPLYAITNFPAERWPETVARFPTLGRFRDVVVSGAVRRVKPGREIFELFLERNGLRAEACLFIDDSAPNVAAAAALGMATHHFAEPDALRRDLEARGLL